MSTSNTTRAHSDGGAGSALGTFVGLVVLTFVTIVTPTAQAASLEIRPGSAVRATLPGEAQLWGRWIEGRAALGGLRLIQTIDDEGTSPASHARYEQLIGGVPVFGAQLVEQLGPGGEPRTVFGYVYDGPTPDTTPTLKLEAARDVVLRIMGADTLIVDPRLVILPLEDGAQLVYTLRGRRSDPPTLMRYFIDARTGAVVKAYEDLKTDNVPMVGLGSGVWDDRKKMATVFDGAEYQAIDQVRPARVTTYDMQFDTWAYDLRNFSPYVATTPDNRWLDGATVDAHNYAGLTYDYYFARHSHAGIDGHNLPTRNFVHVLPGYVNAFWDDTTSSMTYGDGGPYGSTTYAAFSGALDVVAHELTHGVTTYSWNGIYENESGALNEAFSDIMATGVEFMWEPAGNGRRQADYWIGEDLSRTFDPAQFAIRSMENPGLFKDPDHYSIRYRGPADAKHDWGGVHINSGIANQAFYLLVAGGTNRTSGLTVRGLGAARRADVERIFFRGFTRFLTPSATFRDARAATLQAATELFGAGSEAVLATAAAWTAVGVE